MSNFQKYPRFWVISSREARKSRILERRVTRYSGLFPHGLRRGARGALWVLGKSARGIWPIFRGPGSRGRADPRPRAEAMTAVRSHMCRRRPRPREREARAEAMNEVGRARETRKPGIRRNTFIVSRIALYPGSWRLCGSLR